MKTIFTSRRFLLETLFFLSLPSALSADSFAPIQAASWIAGVTRMGYMVPGEIDRAAAAGVQVAHFNLVWPYYPLRRDGGGLASADADRLRRLVEDCQMHGIKAAKLRPLELQFLLVVE